MTVFYSMPFAKKQLENEEPLTKAQLFENDIYSLHVTFKQISDMFPDKISSDCHFANMLKDLENTKESLNAKLDRWQKIIANDLSFIDRLCSQFYAEDKLLAIPQALKLSKYKYIFDHLFSIKESEDPKYIKDDYLKLSLEDSKNDQDGKEEKYGIFLDPQINAENKLP